jgi:hypothetical protein
MSFEPRLPEWSLEAPAAAPVRTPAPAACTLTLDAPRAARALTALPQPARTPLARLGVPRGSETLTLTF